MNLLLQDKEGKGGLTNGKKNFMLMCGYVTIEKQERREEYIIGKLRIPNLEVKVVFRTIVNRWFEQNNARKEITDLQKAILKNDKELV